MIFFMLTGTISLDCYHLCQIIFSSEDSISKFRPFSSFLVPYSTPCLSTNYIWAAQRENQHYGLMSNFFFCHNVLQIHLLQRQKGLFMGKNFLTCYYFQATKLRQQVYGDEHPVVKESLNHFTALYAEAGKALYAGRLLQRNN